MGIDFSKFSKEIQAKIKSALEDTKSPGKIDAEEFRAMNLEKEIANKLMQELCGNQEYLGDGYIKAKKDNKTLIMLDMPENNSIIPLTQDSLDYYRMQYGDKDIAKGIYNNGKLYLADSKGNLVKDQFNNYITETINILEDLKNKLDSITGNFEIIENEPPERTNRRFAVMFIRARYGAVIRDLGDIMAQMGVLDAGIWREAMGMGIQAIADLKKDQEFITATTIKKIERIEQERDSICNELAELIDSPADFESKFYQLTGSEYKDSAFQELREIQHNQTDKDPQTKFSECAARFKELYPHSNLTQNIEGWENSVEFQQKMDEIANIIVMFIMTGGIGKLFQGSTQAIAKKILVAAAKGNKKAVIANFAKLAPEVQTVWKSIGKKEFGVAFAQTATPAAQSAATMGSWEGIKAFLNNATNAEEMNAEELLNRTLEGLEGGIEMGLIMGGLETFAIAPVMTKLTPILNKLTGASSEISALLKKGNGTISMEKVMETYTKANEALKGKIVKEGAHTLVAFPTLTAGFTVTDTAFHFDEAEFRKSLLAAATTDEEREAIQKMNSLELRAEFARTDFINQVKGMATIEGVGIIFRRLQAGIIAAQATETGKTPDMLGANLRAIEENGKTVYEICSPEGEVIPIKDGNKTVTRFSSIEKATAAYSALCIDRYSSLAAAVEELKEKAEQEWEAKQAQETNTAKETSTIDWSGVIQDLPQGGRIQKSFGEDLNSGADIYLNPKGQVVQKITYLDRKNNIIASVEQTEYYPDGNKKGYRIYEEGELDYTVTFLYDNNGNKIRVTTTTPNGNVCSVTTMAYDSNNRLIKRKHFESNKLVSETVIEKDGTEKDYWIIDDVMRIKKPDGTKEVITDYSKTKVQKPSDSTTEESTNQPETSKPEEPGVEELRKTADEIIETYKPDRSKYLKEENYKRDLNFYNYLRNYVKDNNLESLKTFVESVEKNKSAEEIGENTAADASEKAVKTAQANQLNIKSALYENNLDNVRKDIEITLQTVNDKYILETVKKALEEIDSSDMTRDEKYNKYIDIQEIIDICNNLNRTYSTIDDYYNDIQYYKEFLDYCKEHEKVLFKEITNNRTAFGKAVERFMSYMTKNYPNTAKIFGTKYLNTFKENFGRISADFQEEVRIHTLREYCKENNNKLGDYMYEKVYLTSSIIPEEIRQQCAKIHKKFGVKIFVPSDAPNDTKVLDFVKDELQFWSDVSEGKAQLPPTIDFLTAKTDYKGRTIGFCEYYQSRAISLKGFNYEAVVLSLRHEITHTNDIKDVKDFPDGIKSEKLVTYKKGEATAEVDLENCKYVDEFRAGGIPEGHIAYAYKNPGEFIAVACEGDMSKYSNEFKEFLVSLGLPRWALNLPAPKTENIKTNNSKLFKGNNAVRYNKLPNSKGVNNEHEGIKADVTQTEKSKTGQVTTVKQAANDTSRIVNEAHNLKPKFNNSVIDLSELNGQNLINELSRITETCGHKLENNIIVSMAEDGTCLVKNLRNGNYTLEKPANNLYGYETKITYDNEGNIQEVIRCKVKNDGSTSRTRITYKNNKPYTESIINSENNEEKGGVLKVNSSKVNFSDGTTENTQCIQTENISYEISDTNNKTKLSKMPGSVSLTATTIQRGKTRVTLNEYTYPDGTKSTIEYTSKNTVIVINNDGTAYINDRKVSIEEAKQASEFDKIKDQVKSQIEQKEQTSFKGEIPDGYIIDSKTHKPIKVNTETMTINIKFAKGEDGKIDIKDERGNLLGVAEFRTNNKEIYIDSIGSFVNGAGIGTRIINELIKIAQKENLKLTATAVACTGFGSSSKSASNLGFYYKMGFRVTEPEHDRLIRECLDKGIDIPVFLNSADIEYIGKEEQKTGTTAKTGSEALPIKRTAGKENNDSGREKTLEGGVKDSELTEVAPFAQRLNGSVTPDDLVPSGGEITGKDGFTWRYRTGVSEPDGYYKETKLAATRNELKQQSGLLSIDLPSDITKEEIQKVSLLFAVVKDYGIESPVLKEHCIETARKAESFEDVQRYAKLIRLFKDSTNWDFTFEWKIKDFNKLNESMKSNPVKEELLDKLLENEEKIKELWGEFKGTSNFFTILERVTETELQSDTAMELILDEKYAKSITSYNPGEEIIHTLEETLPALTKPEQKELYKICVKKYGSASTDNITRTLNAADTPERVEAATAIVVNSSRNDFSVKQKIEDLHEIMDLYSKSSEAARKLHDYVINSGVQESFLLSQMRDMQKITEIVGEETANNLADFIISENNIKAIMGIRFAVENIKFKELTGRDIDAVSLYNLCKDGMGRSQMEFVNEVLTFEPNILTSKHPLNYIFIKIKNEIKTEAQKDYAIDLLKDSNVIRNDDWEDIKYVKEKWQYETAKRLKAEMDDGQSFDNVNYKDLLKQNQNKAFNELLNKIMDEKDIFSKESEARNGNPKSLNDVLISFKKYNNETQANLALKMLHSKYIQWIQYVTNEAQAKFLSELETRCKEEDINTIVLKDILEGIETEKQAELIFDWTARAGQMYAPLTMFSVLEDAEIDLLNKHKVLDKIEVSNEDFDIKTAIGIARIKDTKLLDKVWQIKEQAKNKYEFSEIIEEIGNESNAKLQEAELDLVLKLFNTNFDRSWRTDVISAIVTSKNGRSVTLKDIQAKSRIVDLIRDKQFIGEEVGKRIIGNAAEYSENFIRNLIQKYEKGKITKEQMSDIVSYINTYNIKLAEKLCFDEKENFPPEYIDTILQRIGKEEDNFVIKFAEMLCFDKNLNFPREYIANIVQNLRENNLELAGRLCTDKKLNFPKKYIGNTIIYSHRNPEIIKELIFNKELNFPPEYIKSVLANISKENKELAIKLIFDKKLNFPPEYIGPTLEEAAERTVKTIEKLCYNKDVDPKYIKTFAQYINNYNHHKERANQVENLTSSPEITKWTCQNLENGHSVETINNLARTQNKLYTEARLTTEATNAEAKKEAARKAQAEAAKQNVQVIADPKALDNITKALVEAGINENRARGDYAKVCLDSYGNVDQAKLDAACALIKAFGFTTSIRKKTGQKITNPNLSSKDIADIFKYATGDKMSAQNGEFRPEIIRDIISIKEAGVDDVKFIANLAYIKNMSLVEMKARIPGADRKSVAERIDTLDNIIFGKALKNKVDLLAIKDKALTSDKKIDETVKIKEGQAAKPVNIRSKRSIVGTEKIVVEKFKIPEEVWKDEDLTRQWVLDKITGKKDADGNITEEGIYNPETGEIRSDLLAEGKYEVYNKARIQGIKEWYEFLNSKDSTVKDDIFGQLIFLDGITKEMKPDNAVTPPSISVEEFEKVYNKLLEGTAVSVTKEYHELNRNKAVQKYGIATTSKDGIKGFWVKIPQGGKRGEPEYDEHIAMIQALSEGSSWCLRFENAHNYLAKGDLHFFVTQKADGSYISHTAINVTKGGEIIEIEKRYDQNSTVPVPYVQVIDEWRRDEYGNIRFTGYKEQIQEALDAKPAFDSQKALFTKMQNENNITGIFKELGFEVEVSSDGSFVIDKYNAFVKDKPYTLQDLGVDENKLMENVSVIKNGLNLKGSGLTEAKKLKRAGSITFGDGGVGDIRALEEIGDAKVYWDTSAKDVKDEAQTKENLIDGKYNRELTEYDKIGNKIFEIKPKDAIENPAKINELKTEIENFRTKEPAKAEELSIILDMFTNPMDVKKVTDKEIDAVVNYLNKHYDLMEDYLTQQSDGIGISDKNIGRFGHRIKGEWSTRDKVANYIKNAIEEGKTKTLLDAYQDVRDKYACRTVFKAGNYLNHPEVKAILEEGKYSPEAYRKAVLRAAEIQSQPAVEMLKEAMRKAVQEGKDLRAIRISNYASKNGIPIFSERQLAEIKREGARLGLNVDFIRLAEEIDPRLSEKERKEEEKKLTTKAQPSGYTALQINFVTKTGEIIEWQYRGKLVNDFAEAEHLPYDLRTGKHPWNQYPELETLFKPVAELLSDKNMPEEAYKQLNKYFTDYYTHLRKLELGFESKEPKLENYEHYKDKNGVEQTFRFDKRLNAKNLEKLHFFGEGIKDGLITPEEALQQFNEEVWFAET